MKRIPNSTDDFKTMIDKNMYFVDKSMLIEHIMDDQISLIPRPRRFGKTLNMSMLKYFYSIKEKDNAYLFHDLKITHSIAMKDQNQFPVIMLTLKDMIGEDFESALYDFKFSVAHYLSMHQELLHSSKIDANTMYLLQSYWNRTANDKDYELSLYTLSVALYQHYEKKVIILIDEYDVPLQNAYAFDLKYHDSEYTFYNKMALFFKILFSKTFKSNLFLEKAVLTGCLRIAKESIFTGMNNLEVHSIFDNNTATDFGFTQEEINSLLQAFSLTQYSHQIKDWYDGYHFGKADIYNPWSVMNYLKNINNGNTTKPISYWANTSGNDIIYHYISKADASMKQEFDALVNDHPIVKEIHGDLTYRELDSIDHIYSFLLFTGYLKYQKEVRSGCYELSIPNKEIKEIYTRTFNQWFKEEKRSYGPKILNAFLSGDPNEASLLLNAFMNKTISYYDTLNENSYHMMLIGLLSSVELVSNREAGLGRFDIAYIPGDVYSTAFIIEYKVAPSDQKREESALTALSQIKNKGYAQSLKRQGYRKIHCYSVSFYKKNASIVIDE